MIAHEKGFKFHAQPQTGAYSCSVSWVVARIIDILVPTEYGWQGPLATIIKP